MLFHFEGQDFSPLGYNDLIAIASELGGDYFGIDTKVAYDTIKYRIKQKEERSVNNGG